MVILIVKMGPCPGCTSRKIPYKLEGGIRQAYANLAMANRNRNRANGGGQGGGGGGNIAITGHIDGPLNSCSIRARIMKGRLPVSGENLRFRFGTSERLGSWMKFPENPNNPYVLTTDSEGEVESTKLDLSDINTFAPNEITHIWVIYNRQAQPNAGLYETPLALPSRETIGKISQAPKAERLRVNVEGDSIKAKKFQATLPLETLDKTGENGEAGLIEVVVTKGRPVTLFDPRTDTSLTTAPVKFHALTTNPDGRFHLGVNLLRQFEVEMEIYHPASRQKRLIKLCYAQ